MSGFTFLAGMATWAIWVVAAVAAMVVAILCYALFVFFSAHKHLKKQITKMQERYQKIVSIMDTDVDASMARLNYLGTHSPKYHDLFVECQAAKERIEKDQQVRAKEVVTSFDSLTASRNYRAIHKNLQEGNSVLVSFETKVEELRKALADVLTKDNQYHEMITKPKEKLRDLKSYLYKYDVEIGPVKPVLESFYRGLDEYFDQYDVFLDKGLYEQADKVFREVSSVIDALDLYGRDLPEIVPLAEMVVPNKLKDLYLAAKDTERQVPIYHLKVDEALKEMALEDQEIKQSFQTLALKGDKERLHGMVDRISALEASFEKEKEAKKLFESKWDSSNDVIYQLQAKYSGLVEKLPSLKEAYVLDSRFLSPVESMTDRVENMVRLKSDLDGSVNASYPQPYSYLLSKFEELNREVDYVSLTMKTFGDYVERIKNRIGVVNQEIRSLYLALWEESAKIREFDLQQFTATSRKTLTSMFAMLEKTAGVIADNPVNIVVAEELEEQTDAEVRKFLSETEKNLDLAHKAEEALVYGNQYRREFTKAEDDLVQAEAAFQACQFDRCYDIASSVIREHREAESSTTQAQ